MISRKMNIIMFTTYIDEQKSFISRRRRLETSSNGEIISILIVIYVILFDAISFMEFYFM